MKFSELKVGDIVKREGWQNFWYEVISKSGGDCEGTLKAIRNGKPPVVDGVDGVDIFPEGGRVLSMLHWLEDGWILVTKEYQESNKYRRITL